MTATFDETKHPRHPAGSSQGGEFAPAGTSGADPNWWKTIKKPLYHLTTRDRVDKILKEGLLSAGPREEAGGASRPGHVYFFSDPRGVDAFWKWGREEFDPSNTVLLAVDPQALNPAKLAADEDYAQFATDEGIWNAPQWGGDQPLGEWANARGFRSPSEVRESYEQWGSVAYGGKVAPDAIWVAEELDPETGRAWGEGRPAGWTRETAIDPYAPVGEQNGITLYGDPRGWQAGWQNDPSVKLYPKYEWVRSLNAAAIAWDPAQHPRHPGGTEAGGEFAPKDSVATSVGEAQTEGGRAFLAEDELWRKGESPNAIWNPKAMRGGSGGEWELKPRGQWRRIDPGEPHTFADLWPDVYESWTERFGSDPVLIDTSPPNPRGSADFVKKWIVGKGRNARDNYPWHLELRTEYARQMGLPLPEERGYSGRTWPLRPDEVEAATKGFIETLPKAPPAQPALWRGLGDMRDSWAATVANAKTGDTLEMLPASYSRSPTKAGSYAFTGGEQPAVMLHVLPGSRGLADKRPWLKDEEVISAGSYEVVGSELVKPVHEQEKRPSFGQQPTRVVTVRQVDVRPGVTASAWQESQHPRHPEGSSEGGRFAPKDEPGDVFRDFPRGIWDAEDSVKFWPQKLGSFDGEPLWKAIIDDDGEERAFWFADEKGFPHHDAVNARLGRNEGEGTFLAGYGDDVDISGYLGDDLQYQAELEAENIHGLLDLGDYHAIYARYGYIGADVADLDMEGLRELVMDDLTSRYQSIPRRHRRDIKDAEQILEGEVDRMFASAALNFESEALTAATERLQRQYEKVYRRALAAAAWDPAQHPRHPGGSAQGGEFMAARGARMQREAALPENFPPGEWDPEGKVKFWPDQIGNMNGGAAWKAWMDPMTGRELAFWFVTPTGFPHHLDMAHALGIETPKVDEVLVGPLRVSGYGNKPDMQWMTSYFAQDLGANREELARLARSGGNRLHDMIMDSVREIAQRHRKDIEDADIMATMPLAASALFDQLAEAEAELARQYEKVLRRAAKRAATQYRAAMKVVTAAGQPQPEEVLAARALLDSFLRVTGVARRNLLTQVLHALGVLQADEGDDSSDTEAIATYIELLQEQAGVQASRLVAGSQDAVADVLLDAMAQGWSVPQTAKALEEKLVSVAPWQATMLARTDMVALANGASLKRAVILDDPNLQFKTWLATPDERTRINHRHAHGQTVPIRQPFTVGGEQLLYPGDPSASDGNVCNCRCTVVYGDSPMGPMGVRQIEMLPDLAISAAGWEEREHPRHPKGSEDGGKFAPKYQRVGGFMEYQQGEADLGIQDDPELDQQIVDAVTQFQRGFSSMRRPGIAITAPRRSSPSIRAMARAMWEATNGDVRAVVRALDSAEMWGTGWDQAYDEWDAMHQLTGGVVPKRIADDLKRFTSPEHRWSPGFEHLRPPLSENDLKAFAARQKWYQDTFRSQYPDGVWAYRGIKGKRAAKPWLEAGLESYERRWADEQKKSGSYFNYDAQKVYSDPIEGPAWGLSSWHENSGYAAQFAYGKTGRTEGVIVRTPIKPEDIWMVPVLGGQGPIKFADVTGEYVITNPEGTRKAELVGYQRT